MNQESLLAVENLSIRFGDDQPAVKGISFCLKSGEVLGIVGESGSGKSITCLSIMQLLSRKVNVGGNIHYNNENLLTLNEKEINTIRGKEISMIFQEPMSSLNPSHRCGNQILEAIVIHQKIDKAAAKEKVLSLLSDVSLLDPQRIYNSYPHELSGGQLQRVMIAMAIANYPKIIIADEPTTALDVTVQRNIMELFGSIIKQYNSSLIFISHDLGVVKSIADRVIVMKNGEIVEEGLVENVFKHPTHPYTKGLLACRPPLDLRLKRLPTVQDFLSNPDEEIRDFKNRLEIDRSSWQKNIDELSSKAPLLKVNQLSKEYVVKRNWFGKPIKTFKAVDDVSFTLRKGEILGLVGESGSGKSTCGRSILRLTEPTFGSVWFDGMDVTQLDKKELRSLRKDFQIIFQDPYSSLNPRIKIGEAIMEPMKVHHIGNSNKERKELANQLLSKVGLSSDHFDRYPHQFSGGQRQRICIARTLSLNPKFIVCDESVSALDVSVQAQILNLLLDLKEEFDLSYLFISHDISVVKFLCDNIMVMKEGRIVETGTAEDIYSNPKEVYTQQLINAIYK